MPNMSYCRFENTLADLNDCANNMHEVDDLSEYEVKARKKLLLLCKAIAEDYELEIEEIEQERAAKS